MCARTACKPRTCWRRLFAVDDHGLTTRKENEAFKRERHVASTPQVLIGSERVGGYDASLTHLVDRPPDPDATTYTPVLVVFALAALTGLAMSWAAYGMLLMSVPWSGSSQCRCASWPS